MPTYQPDPDSARDRHLFGPGPKRILALSGGGVRGAVTVAFLKRIEQILDEKAGGPVRLGDYFDLIGGTSTGALIAGALAVGYRVDQITSFYTEHAGSVFQPRGGLQLRRNPPQSSNSHRSSLICGPAPVGFGS